MSSVPRTLKAAGEAAAMCKEVAVGTIILAVYQVIVFCNM